MEKEQKSYHLHIDVNEIHKRDQMLQVVERAVAQRGLYISHIGGYSRVKFPNSVHWHFKRAKKEPGLIEATFWEEGHKFWMIMRNNEPAWVHETAPLLHAALIKEVNA